MAISFDGPKSSLSLRCYDLELWECCPLVGKASGIFLSLSISMRMGGLNLELNFTITDSKDFEALTLGGYFEQVYKWPVTCTRALGFGLGA